jgi:predicted SnoaL-like aldol condensation-catalyzing enzyme
VTAREVVERFVAIVNSHRFSDFAEVVAQDDRQHAKGEQGLAGLVALFEQMLVGMPDLRGELSLVIVEGDMVAARTIVSGTRDGSPVSNAISDFWRVSGGKLREHW